MKTDEERIVDLQDITSSGFVYTKNIFWLTLSVLGLMWSLVGTVAAIKAQHDVLQNFMVYSGWIPDIIFWIIYFFRNLYYMKFLLPAVVLQ